MAICCVHGCSNRSDRKRKAGISFHKFPRNGSLREEWIKAVERLNWKPIASSVICSEHFSKECLNRTFASGHTELRENAVPTIFPQYEPKLLPNNKKELRTNMYIKKEPVIEEISLESRQQRGAVTRQNNLWTFMKAEEDTITGEAFPFCAVQVICEI